MRQRILLFLAQNSLEEDREWDFQQKKYVKNGKWKERKIYLWDIIDYLWVIDDPPIKEKVSFLDVYQEVLNMQDDKLVLIVKKYPKNGCGTIKLIIERP